LSLAEIYNYSKKCTTEVAIKLLKSDDILEKVLMYLYDKDGEENSESPNWLVSLSHLTKRNHYYQF